MCKALPGLSTTRTTLERVFQRGQRYMYHRSHEVEALFPGMPLLNLHCRRWSRACLRALRCCRALPQPEGAWFVATIPELTGARFGSRRDWWRTAVAGRGGIQGARRPDYPQGAA